MTEFIEKYITTDDNIKIYYRHYNAGMTDKPTIICLPALTRNSKSFHAYAVHIADKFQTSVISIDTRGRGQSGYDAVFMNYNLFREATDTLAVLDYENITNIIIIGTSRGGMQSSLLASMIPQKIKGVILNDIGATIPMPALEWLKKLFSMDSNFIGDYKTALRYFYIGDNGMTKNLSPEQEIDIINSLYAFDGENYSLDYDYKGLGQAYLASFHGTDNLLYCDLKALFTALKTIPTMLLHGIHSDILTDICVFDTKNLLPHIEYHQFCDRGHVLYFNEPAVIAVCDNFIERLL